MRLSEYAALDGTGLAEALAAGQVTADEVYSAARTAIESVEDKVHAVVEGPWDRPMEYSKGGSFAGVPLVLKDLGAHPAGVPMRSGTRLSGPGVVFEEESSLIRRFRDAGFAIAATTTVPEFGINATSEALAYGGPTRNPWDLEHSAGGSSGGSAALVAAGAVPVGHANDGGGSIRIPACFNGLVGLKPSRGRISNAPDRLELAWGFATEGVVTRTVRDAAAVLDVMAGYEPGDKFVIPAPPRPFAEELSAEPGRLRIAINMQAWSGVAVDDEVRAAVEATGRVLEAAGHILEPGAPTLDWEACGDAIVTVFASLVTESVDTISRSTGLEAGPETLELTTLACHELGRSQTALDMARAMEAANGVSRVVGEFFSQWDLILTPTVNVPAPRLGVWDANDARLDGRAWLRRIWNEACGFTALFNITGDPAISLPLGTTSAGLPIGVQLAAPMGGEATLLQIAAMLETQMPWEARKPQMWVG